METLKSDESHPFTERTKKVDVYSFAIVAYEILTARCSWIGVRKFDLINAVLSGKRPEFHDDFIQGCSKLDKDSLDSKVIKVIQIVKQCWAISPDDRPTFAMILEKLK